MTDYYVRICAFDDLQEVKRAVKSVPAGIAVHVCDGRYATFGGNTDLTPGLAEVCESAHNVHYHAPPEDRLPFGHELLANGVPPEWRPGVYDKAQWMEEVLPQDEWTLKLDADETLTDFDADLDDFDRRFKYCPIINLHGQRKDAVYIARLWVPEHWTPWVDDCLLPAAIFPRDHPLEHLQRVWREDEWTAIRFLRRGQTAAIEIDNYGGERPAEYQRRRVEHLKRIGRDDRWTDIKRELDEPTA